MDERCKGVPGWVEESWAGVAGEAGDELVRGSGGRHPSLEAMAATAAPG